MAIRSCAYMCLMLVGLARAGVALAQSPPHEPAPEIWFAPMTWEISPQTHQIDYSMHDFPDFLQPAAPWQQAASRTAVVALPHNVVWSYPNRSELISFFREHHFKTAFGFGMLFDKGECPESVEGISKDSAVNVESVNVAKLWNEAGGSLDYIIMDGPLGYGHILVPKCRYSVEEIARRAASTLKGIQAFFPHVRVVDSEGTGRMMDAEWLKLMDTWTKAFKRAAGVPIEAEALDLGWDDLRPGESWERTTGAASRFFSARGIKTGLIINDNKIGPSVSDETWMAANRRHIKEVADRNGLGLAFLLINGWMHHPRRNLPETDPTAYTSLIDYAYDQLHVSR